MIRIKTYDNFIFESHNSSLIPVVRWSGKKIPASELKPQKFDWGGFEATALCFTPYDGPDDPRLYMWKDMVAKQHKKELVPNFYYLDCSNFQFKTEEELKEFAKLTYKSIKAERIMRDEYKIHLSLSQEYGKLQVVEIRLYEGCSIKILDQ